MKKRNFDFTRRNWKWMTLLFVAVFFAFMATGNTWLGILGAGGLLFVFAATIASVDDF